MLKNYLLTIFRQIRKNTSFSLINILGLAVGMSACLAISQYVFFHASFDQYHDNVDQIVRIHSHAIKNGEDLGEQSGAAAMFAPTIAEQSPDVITYGRLWSLSYLNNTIAYKGDQVYRFQEPSVYGADKSLFDVFDFGLVAGNLDDFHAPQKMIMTMATAQKYFDDPQNAIGKSVVLSGNNGDNKYEVVAIMEDLPENSHMEIAVLVSMVSIDNYTRNRTTWTSNVFYSYLLLTPGVDRKRLTDELNRLYADNAKEVVEGYGYQIEYSTMPVRDLHLYYSGNDFVPPIDLRLLIALEFIALIILVIAWINYLNLALVKTVDRLKEVGIRKAMGSTTRQITTLFMLEALFLNLLAFLVSLTITQLSSPFLESLTGLKFNLPDNVNTVLILFGIVLVGTLSIGYYPAIILRTFNASNILLGNRRSQKVGRFGLRSVLVSLQFIITFLLIGATLTVWKQVSYMRDAETRINMNNVMVLKAPPGDISSEDRQDVVSYNAFKTELLKNSGIATVTNGGELPGAPINWETNIHLSNKTTNESVNVDLLSCGIEYLDFFDLDVVAGRKLIQGDDPWEKADAVINEKLAGLLGFENPEDAIGAKLSGFYVPLEVRGVIENHHHVSLHHDFTPIAFILSSWSEYYFVRFNIADDLNPEDQMANYQSLVNTVRQEWNSAFPDHQIDFFFLDEFYDRQYETDDQFGRIFTTFSSLAILIACLGLFGLTSFTLQQRTKEIGIRKVLGAQTSNLLLLLSKNYILTISIAYLIATPIVWIFMDRWLENYTFRIELGIWLLTVPLFFVFAVAVLTIFSKLIKSIKINPVDSLRYE